MHTWQDDEYPDIEARAKAEGAEIHWGDETALVNADVRGRIGAAARSRPASSWQNRFSVAHPWAAENTICENLDLNGFTNWHLPTPEQLDQIHTRLLEAGRDGLATNAA